MVFQESGGEERRLTIFHGCLESLLQSVEGKTTIEKLLGLSTVILHVKRDVVCFAKELSR